MKKGIQINDWLFLKGLLSVLVFLFMFVASSCSTSNISEGQSIDNSRPIITARELPYHIDKLSRLKVQGSGATAQVINTSVTTITGDNRPLFVLDDVQLGRDFGSVLKLLNRQQEISVEFLTTRRATTRFGEAGKNGVLVIRRIHI